MLLRILAWTNASGHAPFRSQPFDRTWAECAEALFGDQVEVILLEGDGLHERRSVASEARSRKQNGLSADALRGIRMTGVKGVTSEYVEQPLVIFGAGGFGREVHQLVIDLNNEEPTTQPWKVLGWLDGEVSKHGSEVHSLPVLGDEHWLADHPGVTVAVGVGSPAAKKAIVGGLRAVGHRRFATLVHPRAWLGRNVSLGEGTIVCAGALLTTDIDIGSFVTINLGCTIGHDAVLRDFVTLYPTVNVSGDVLLEEGVDFGTGGSIIQGKSVGSGSVVGAGAVVVRDLPLGVTAVGVPAKVIKGGS